MKYGRITKPLLELSESDNYDLAKKEWRITGNVWNGPPANHESDHLGNCLCGQSIWWHFEIENTENGLIEIVGSDCVENWMVYRHLTENKKINPNIVTEEKIKEWMENMVLELKASAWMEQNGEMFNEMFPAIAEIDLRVNIQQKGRYYDHFTRRWKPKFVIRKRAKGKPNDVHYQMASVVWRWNHPENEKNQLNKYGYPNDRLWADIVMLYYQWKDKIEKFSEVDEETKKKLAKELRDEGEMIVFHSMCELFGIPTFSVEDANSAWEAGFLESMRRQIMEERAPSERQFEILRGIFEPEEIRATEKQIRYMQRLGIEIPENCSKKNASELIDTCLQNKN